MSSSMATLSRRLLHRCLLSNPKSSSHFSAPFSTSSFSSHENSENEESTHDSDIDSPASTDQSSSPSVTLEGNPLRGPPVDRQLEDGLDVGIYKAIIVGRVGLTPVQKRLKSGRVVTLLSVGTGGIRNNRRPLQNEDPREYANRCAVQWHRVSIYPEPVGEIVMKNATPGSILYLEGNLETKIFSDPITGLVRRIREIAIRRNGRVVFIGKSTDAEQPTQSELRGVGYY